MPTRAVAAETMEVGSGNRKPGKHWTKAQVAARQEAAAEMERQSPVVLDPPPYVKNSPSRMEVWNTVIAKAEGIGLLDNLDADTLGLYCDVVVQYQKCTLRKRKSVDAIKEQQAWARIMTQLSDKLGLNPAARARLIKKKAEKKLDQFGEKFD